jgi:hypothetical protein
MRSVCLATAVSTAMAHDAPERSPHVFEHDAGRLSFFVPDLSGRESADTACRGRNRVAALRTKR